MTNYNPFKPGKIKPVPTVSGYVCFGGKNTEEPFSQFGLTAIHKNATLSTTPTTKNRPKV
jgi:hypothetical protein